MAEDDSRCCFGLFGPPNQPYNVKIRTRACFFIARLMVMLPDLETPPKSQKITKNWIFKNRIFLIEKIVRIDTPSKNLVFTHFQKIRFLFFINLLVLTRIYNIRAQGPRGPRRAQRDPGKPEEHSRGPPGPLGAAGALGGVMPEALVEWGGSGERPGGRTKTRSHSGHPANRASYGMVWYGMVWYGMARHGTARHGMVWYGMGL